MDIITRSAKALEILFFDRMTTQRSVKTKDAYGATKTVLEDYLVDIKCKFSYAGYDTPHNTNIEDNPKLNLPKVFCNRTLDIKKGDFIKIVNKSDTGVVLKEWEGKVGDTNIFSNHMEALIEIKGQA